jgi:hypothetical protein
VLPQSTSRSIRQTRASIDACGNCIACTNTPVEAGGEIGDSVYSYVFRLTNLTYATYAMCKMEAVPNGISSRPAYRFMQVLGRFLGSSEKAVGSRKGSAFERLTQLYLKTAPEYRTKLQDVWLRSEVPVDHRGN